MLAQLERTDYYVLCNDYRIHLLVQLSADKDEGQLTEGRLKNIKNGKKQWRVLHWPLWLNCAIKDQTELPTKVCSQ